MATVKITVRERIAIVEAGVELVCNNPTDSIEFDFDEEWSAHNTKTARFSWDGRYIDVVFDGNTVKVPEIYKTTYVFVGVFSDGITTTPAKVPTRFSIKCHGGTVVEPHPDVYAQILEKLNTGGGSGEMNGKTIVGVKDGNNITFSKTATEIYELGYDALTYDIIFTENGIPYKAYRRRGYTPPSSTSSDRSLRLTFIAIGSDRLEYYDVTFHERGTITCTSGVKTTLLQNIPNPTQDRKYVVAEGLKYDLVDGPQPDNPLLTAILYQGVLIPQYTETLPTLLDNMMETENVTLNLAVIELDSSGNYETVSAYRIAKIYNASDANTVYAIFTNGIDRNIKMDASGNFFYIE